MHTPLPDQIFALPRVPARPGGPALHPLVAGTLERLFALRRLDEAYRGVGGGEPGGPFAVRALQRLAITWHASAEDLAHLPAEGPAVVVCNHPFGAVEGLVLAALAAARRPDLRILANRLLCRVPELQDLVIPVEVFGGPGAARLNAAALRRAGAWLGAGGAVALFPAGEVAHLQPGRWLVTDPPWQPGAARLVRASGAPAVPVFFPGGNGALFQGAGLLHPGLRTALLPRELLNKRGRRIEVRIGAPVPAAVLARFEDDRKLLEHLRLRTYALGARPRRAAGASPAPARLPLLRPRPAPVAAPAPPGVLAEEIARLPREALLAGSGEQEVWCVGAAEAPELLREVGRLREVTFRLAGEGSGRPLDLDRFDATYRHLVLWDRASGAVAGAYRIGMADRLLQGHGPAGLYTSTLFSYRPGFFERVSPALELGRSFVVPAYQKSYGALLLLWRGIGSFLVANSRYRYLFGPVSISERYQPLSRELMVAFLQASRPAADLAGLVRPRTPLPAPRHRHFDPARTAEAIGDLDGLGALVGDIEPDGAGVPILLRHYLKLDARVAAFNRDPQFSGVWDCLLVVDLWRAQDALLARYLGRDGLAAYRARARAHGAAAAGRETARTA